MPEKGCSRCQQAPQARNFAAQGPSAYQSGFDEFDSALPFATAFVRPQTQIYELFSPSEGLACGTIFPELYNSYTR